MTGSTSRSNRPHVLLASVDSLRGDVVQETSPPTPFLDSIAAEGLEFRRCFSTGAWTAPSFVGMMTGEHPRSFARDMSVHSFPETLAERLKDQGYRTVAKLDANYWISAEQGFDRGFDDFDNYVDSEGFLASKDREADEDRNELAERLPDGVVDRFPGTVDAAWDSLRSNDTMFSILQSIDMMVGTEKKGRGAEPLVEDFTRAFTSDAGPTFGWIHFMDVHHPYLPDRRSIRDHLEFPGPLVEYVNNASVRPEVTLGTRGARLLQRSYNRKVTEIDQWLQDLVRSLESQLDRELVVIIVGDHGEEFGEHGRFNHRNRPFTELIHVPLLVRGVDPGEVTRYTSLIDFKAAVEAICRGERDVTEYFETDVPCCRYMHHGERVTERTQQALSGREEPSEWITVLDGGLKLHYSPTAGSIEVYDLESDFYEQGDRSGDGSYENLLSEAIAHHIQEEQELADLSLLRAIDL